MNNSSKNDIKRNTYSNMSKTHMTTNSKEKWAGTNTNAGDEVDMKMEKIFSDQKKAMMKIKQLLSPASQRLVLFWIILISLRIT